MLNPIESVCKACVCATSVHIFPLLQRCQKGARHRSTLRRTIERAAPTASRPSAASVQRRRAASRTPQPTKTCAGSKCLALSTLQSPAATRSAAATNVVWMVMVLCVAESNACTRTFRSKPSHRSHTAHSTVLIRRDKGNVQNFHTRTGTELTVHITHSAQPSDYRPTAFSPRKRSSRENTHTLHTQHATQS